MDIDTTITQHMVLTALKGVDAVECRKTVLDYDKFMLRVQRMIFIQSFIVHFESAEKSYRRGDNFGEKKSLIFAMNILETDKITDEDLNITGLLDYITRTDLSSDLIAKRLQQLY